MKGPSKPDGTASNGNPSSSEPAVAGSGLIFTPPSGRPQVSGRFYTPVPAPPRNLDRGLWKWLDALGPSSPAYNWLVAITAVLGVVCVALDVANPDPGAAQTKKLKVVRVIGNVTVASHPTGLENLAVLMQFPEIPYQKLISWKDLPVKPVADSSGSVTLPLEVHFRCFVRPQHYTVSVLEPGSKAWVSPSLLLEDGRGKCDIPHVRLERAPRP